VIGRAGVNGRMRVAAAILVNRATGAIAAPLVLAGCGGGVGNPAPAVDVYPSLPLQGLSSPQGDDAFQASGDTTLGSCGLHKAGPRGYPLYVRTITPPTAIGPSST
jgi:hypothetical protein